MDETKLSLRLEGSLAPSVPAKVTNCPKVTECHSHVVSHLTLDMGPTFFKWE